MASIQKLTRRRRDTKTGKTVQSSVYRVFIRRKGLRPITRTFSTKKLATAFAQRIEGDREALIAYGSCIPQQMPLSQLIDEYVSQYRRKDQGILSRLAWWRDRYWTTTLDAIDRRLVRSALDELAQGRAHRGHGRIKGKTTVVSTDRPRAPSTLNRYKAALSAVFEFGRDRYDLPSNPCRQVKARPESRGRTRFLSERERQALLAACRASDWDKLHLLVSLALVTGARLSELLWLRWGEIDLQARRAYVEKTKNGEPRVLPLTQELIAELEQFKFAETAEDELIFASERQPGRPYEFRKHWVMAREAAELVDFRFHDLRHSAASMLAMKGATLLQIAEVLGHRDTTVTKRYAHLCIDHKQRLIDQVMGNLLEISQ
ncbi:MAG: site-specific integrase [Sedimenticola sp.]